MLHKGNTPCETLPILCGGRVPVAGLLLGVAVHFFATTQGEFSVSF